jgi:hypothetical protein
MSKERLSHQLRHQVRERQGYRCALCNGSHPPGDKGCISIHHRLPKCRRGTDDPGNLVGLCRGPGTNECHDLLDYLTLERGFPFEQVMEEGLSYAIGLANSLPPSEDSKVQRYVP